MIPEATVYFDSVRDETYKGKVIVRHSWVYLVNEHEIYPSDKIQRIDMHNMEMDGPIDKLKDMFDMSVTSD
jgi:hypothetical protein